MLFIIISSRYLELHTKVKTKFSGLPHVRKWSEEKSSSRSGKVTEFYCVSGKMKALNIEPGIILK